MKVTFYGAARTVTGSKHMITTKGECRFLLDCGMFQGKGKDSDELNRSFGFNPQDVDFVILSHAHIDHSGLLPKLVKEGFKGKIYATPATRDLCEIMLRDSAYIQESDVYYINKAREEHGKDPIEPLYKSSDVADCMDQFVTVPYHQKYTVNDEVSFTFYDAGHILGSAGVLFEVNEGDRTNKTMFTGDIGRYVNRILRFPDKFPQVDFIISEATYGDREHESAKSAAKKLLSVIEETCVVKKGKLIIPAFSVGKTQELIYTLDKMKNKGQLPDIKVFVDSPLAINATEIIKAHSDCFSESILEYTKEYDDPFGFNKLNYVREVEESKAINNLEEPAIIISASGMADAGRVTHHLVNSIENPRNSVLFIGYCEPGSVGGRLIAGEEEISLFGKQYGVNADVSVIDFFSAHADRNEILRYLSCQNPSKVEEYYLVHGNSGVLDTFADTLFHKGFNNVIVGEYRRTYHL